MNILRSIVFSVLIIVTHLAQAHGDLHEYYQLDSTEIISVFAGYTLHTINERTRDNIHTYLDKNGTVKQAIPSSKVQRSGTWHAANHQLCLKWDDKKSEFCFDKVLYHDKLFLLIKNDKLETVVNKTQMGNRTGF